jgi:hypothetical protein
MLKYVGSTTENGGLEFRFILERVPEITPWGGVVDLKSRESPAQCMIDRKVEK